MAQSPSIHRSPARSSPPRSPPRQACATAIVSDSIKAFPAFAQAIAAAGGGYAAPPPGYNVQTSTYYGQTPTYYGQTPTYYGYGDQAPAPAYGYGQPAQPAYGQQTMVIGAPDVDDAFAEGAGGVGEGIHDPFESVNRGIFYVNDVFDSFLFRPLAIGYRFITPRACAARCGTSS